MAPFNLAAYESCGFCRYISREVECAGICESDLALALANHRRYERGAMLVIPRAHRETVLDIQEAELTPVYLLAKRLVAAAARVLRTVGANVYQNNGVSAGQHIPHFHIHVVPRYESSDP